MAYDIAATEQYIRDAARARGIDPDIAVRVAKSEGLARGVYQSNLGKGGTREPSYGPFQLLVGGEGTNYPAGMGNDFISQTGLDPRDPSTVPAQVDFALDNAAKNGWSAWYGAAKAGVGKRDGIGGNAAPQGTYTRELKTGGGSSMAGYPTSNVGGLGGLGGMMQEEPPAPEGVAGFFQNPGVLDVLQSFGMSLMSSPSNAPLAGAGEYLPGLQAQSDKRAVYADAKKEQNRTLNYLRQNYPEIAVQVDAGLPISDAFRLAQAERMAAAQGPDLTSDQKNFMLAQQDPKFAAFIGANGKPPNIETFINEDGLQTQGYYDPATRTMVQVGGAKAASDANGVTIGPDGTIQVGGTAKPMTEAQSKDAVYSTRAKGALAILDDEKDGKADALTSRGDAALGVVPFGFGRGYQDDDYQLARNAGDEFLQAILRKDTGAGITAQEQSLYGKTYLPEPGDSDALLTQKREARARALAAIEAGMTPTAMVAQELALRKSSKSGTKAAPVVVDGFTIEEVD